jgi:transposase
MFLKRVQVKRADKTYTYLKLVESYRDQGRVRQRLVANLGVEDALKKSGQLDMLAAAFARADPPRVGIRREVGPLLLVAHVLRELNLVKLIDSFLPSHGRAQLSHGEVVAALIANRLCCPAPLYDVAGWATSAAIQELMAIPGMLLNDDRLGRTLDVMASVAESIRGAVALAAIERFGADAARLHLDLTSLRVAGAYEGSALVSKGWGADRKVARQVRLLAATNAEGVPLYVRPEKGDAGELTSLGNALERLVKILPPRPLICTDSAMGYFSTLCAAERAGARFIVPLRAVTGFADRFLRDVGEKALCPLRYVSRRERQLPPSRRGRYRGALRPLEVADPVTGESRAFRVAYIWSSEEAKSVADARERAIEKATTALRTVRNGIGRHYKTLEQLAVKVAAVLKPVERFVQVTTASSKGRPTVDWCRNEQAIRDAARLDGIYALATNLPGRITATTVLRRYKDQYLVEQTHRNGKETLRVRPVFLHNDVRIESLLSIVGLSLLVFGLVESRTRAALHHEPLPGILPEQRAALPTGRSILAAFQGLGLTYTSDGIRLDRLTATQRRLLGLLKAKSPWPELEV